MSKTCDVCGKEIVRNGRYASPRYKKNYFCSEECYKEFLAIKAGTSSKEMYPGLNKLKDCIRDYWGGSENVNWQLTMKWIKYFVEEKGLTCDEMRNTIIYAIKLDNYEINLQHGINQIFPKFIEPYQKFIADYQKNLEAAKKLPDEEYRIVSNTNSIRQKRYNIKDEDW